MARPKKPVALQNGRMSNEEKRIRLEQEEKMKHGTNELKAPSWLDGKAKEEFERVVKSLIELECVGNLDLTILAIYSDAYSNYVKMSKAIQEFGAVEEYTNTQGATNKVVSSYVQAQTKYADMIMKCSSKLGLSVSDRLKLIVTKEDDSQDELLNILNS
ncbi:phage terminase small subunit P27 family [Clostridium senegalense]